MNSKGSYCRPITIPKFGSFFPKMCSDPQCIKISIPTLVFRGGNKNALAITFANILRTLQLSQSLELMGNSEHISIIFNFERNSHDLQHPPIIIHILEDLHTRNYNSSLKQVACHNSYQKNTEPTQHVSQAQINRHFICNLDLHSDIRAPQAPPLC